MSRIVFMGTPEFSVQALQALAKNHKILQVYTQPDRPAGRGQKITFSAVKVAALELGLTVRQPKSLKSTEEIEFLNGLKPDFIVVAAFGMILKKEVLDIPSLGCINIHASLLPRWRGAAPIHCAILNGDPQTGITTMRMNEGLDTGDILEIQQLPIGEHEPISSLHDRLATLGSEMILTTLKGLESRSLKSRPQSELEAQTPATYAKKITKDMQWLDLNRTALECERAVRALNPWPGTRVKLVKTSDGLRLKRVLARNEVIGPEGFCGLFEKSGGLFLSTRSGSLEVQALQWDGRSEIRASEFMSGLASRGLCLPLEVL